MGLFTKDVKIEDKTAAVKKTAQAQINQFIKGQPFGTAPNIPTQQIAGLSPLQQELQKMTGDQIKSGDTGIAQDAFRQEAQRGTDPTDSKEFAAFRQMAERLKTEGQTDIRQRANLGGQLKSTPAAGVEAESNQQFDTALLQQFAQMERQNRQDKLNAASGLTQLGTQRLNDIGKANVIADQERAIEQARNDTVYQQAMDTVLFPYNEQLSLFQLASGQTRDLVKTGGGLTDLGFAAQTAGPIAAAALMSDIRVKENILPIENAVDKIKSLKGYTYNYKQNEAGDRNGGVMAQDLEKVLPDAVVEIDGVKHVKYDAVIGLLVSAVKELAETK